MKQKCILCGSEVESLTFLFAGLSPSELNLLQDLVTKMKMASKRHE